VSNLRVASSAPSARAPEASPAPAAPSPGPRCCCAPARFEFERMAVKRTAGAMRPDWRFAK